MPVLTSAAALVLAPAAEPQNLYRHNATEAAPTPVGLAEIWRAADPQSGAPGLATVTSEFAIPGRFVAIRSSTSMSLIETVTGDVVRRVSMDPRRDVYSFAIAADGRIAIGSLGGLVIEPAFTAGTPGLPRSHPARHACVDACGPVLAVAFSPDGSLLAYQGTRGLRERRLGYGFAVVLDTRTGQAVARLEAIAARALVSFSPDGQRLVASNVTHFDGVERFGLREWDTSDWRLTRNLNGTERRWRAIGRLAEGTFAAVYASGDNIEVRDLASDRTIWSVPLIAQSVEDSSTSVVPELHFVEFAPNGRFLLTYESTDGRAGRTDGALVVRRSRDGRIEAMYDVAGVIDLSIAPDSKAFAYSTRAGGAHTVLARVPL